MTRPGSGPSSTITRRRWTPATTTRPTSSAERCAPFALPDDAAEAPLLIDPSREDPTRVIRYAPVEPDSALAAPRRLRARAQAPLPRLLPEAIDGDPRAEETLRRVGLRTGKLDENWEKHLRPIWRYDVVPLLRAIDDGAPADDIQRRWDTLVQRHVRDPQANRRALTRAFLDHAVPPATRRAHDLGPLPSLEDPGPPAPRAPLSDHSAPTPDALRAWAVDACASNRPVDLRRAQVIFERTGAPLDALADALGVTLQDLRARLDR